MSQAEPHPFVPRHGQVDTTRPPTPDEMAELRAIARRGADALHARAATPDRAPKLTDAENAAIARKRIENGERS